MLWTTDFLDLAGMDEGEKWLSSDIEFSEEELLLEKLVIDLDTLLEFLTYSTCFSSSGTKVSSISFIVSTL